MRRAIVVLFLVSLTGGVLRAQERVAPSLAPGARIRVTIGERRLVGTLERVDADSLVLRVRDRTHRWSSGNVAGVEVGTRRSRTGSTLAGLGIGLGAGALVGAATFSAADDGDDFFGPEFPAVAGAIVGGFLGSITGMIVGYNRPPYRWTQATVPRVGITPTGRGVAVSIAF